MNCDVAVIGGGAAGLACAAELLAAYPELNIVVFEAGDRAGKKLSQTGNGQGNVSNADLNASHYYGGRDLADSIVCSGKYDWKSLFGCLFETDDRGRIYPASKQASSLTDNLLWKIIKGAGEAGADLRLKTRVLGIEKLSSGGFRIVYDGGSLCCRFVVLAAGGKAARQFMTDGSAYALAERLGHSVTPLYPSLVQLKTDIADIKTFRGIRADCAVRAVFRRVKEDCGRSDNAGRRKAVKADGWKETSAAGRKAAGADGRKEARTASRREARAYDLFAEAPGSEFSGADELGSVRGDVIFTSYGVSGNAIFSLSSRLAGIVGNAGYEEEDEETVNGDVHRDAHGDVQGEVILYIDFLPDFKEEQIVSIMERRSTEGLGDEDLLCGTVHNTIARRIIALAGQAAGRDNGSPSGSSGPLRHSGPSDSSGPSGKPELMRRSAHLLKAFPVVVTGTAGFDYAQVTKGGIPCSEVTADLESIYADGLYLAGEILDVDGDCGGYNLQWALCSGMCAAHSILKRMKNV